MPAARSYLFVPADRPDRFERALASGADAVVFDLEDAVAPAARPAAREALAAWLRSRPVSEGGPQRVVRIQAAGSEGFEADLAVCATPAVQAVVLAKAESPEALGTVAQAAPGRVLLPLIETAVGFDRLRELASTPGVQRLLFSAIDFQLDLGIEGVDGMDDDHDALLHFRSQLVLASRLAGLQPPVDGVTVQCQDDGPTADDARHARRLGFGGKLCIHPRQVPVVHAAWAPTPAQCEWAQRVVEAARAAGGAAVAVDGRMVDAPVLRQAQRLLESRR